MSTENRINRRGIIIRAALRQSLLNFDALYRSLGNMDELAGSHAEVLAEVEEIERSLVAVRPDLGDKLSEALAPDAWAEFNTGKGTCSNAAGWRCMQTVTEAAVIMNLLAEIGPIVVPGPSSDALEAVTEQINEGKLN